MPAHSTVASRVSISVSLCQPIDTTLPPGVCCGLQAAQAQHEHEMQQAVRVARQEGASAQWQEWSQGVQAQVQELQAGHAQQLAGHRAAAEQQFSAAMQVSAARFQLQPHPFFQPAPATGLQLPA